MRRGRSRQAVSSCRAMSSGSSTAMFIARKCSLKSILPHLAALSYSHTASSTQYLARRDGRAKYALARGVEKSPVWLACATAVVCLHSGYLSVLFPSKNPAAFLVRHAGMDQLVDPPARFK